MKVKKLKILLINPPQNYFPGSTIFSKSFPVGIASIAAVLLKDGFEVIILDTLFKNFEILKNKDTTTYGMSFSNIEEEIKKRSPDIVGISCPFTTQADNSIKIAEIVKSVNPKIKTIIGGPDSSARAKILMEESNSIDYAVIGEGEYTMGEFAKKIENNDYKGLINVKGLVLRLEDKIIVNQKREFIENLDALPFPAYDLFDMNLYLDSTDEYLYIQRMGQRKRELPMITSRGCPYNCVFCSIHLHMGGKWRFHTSGYVLEHINHLINEYGINHIHFEDDNFTQSLKRTRYILDGIIENNYMLTWDTPNGVRIDHLNEDLVKRMKESGCVMLTVAIESGDQSVLDEIINKKLNLEKISGIVDKIYKIGIPLHSFYVIGFPGEKKEDINKTFEFSEKMAEKFNVTCSIFAATPLYGTKLHKICIDNDYLIKELTPRVLSESTQGKGVIKTKEFSPEYLSYIINRSTQNRILRKSQKRIKKIGQKYGFAGKTIAMIWFSPKLDLFKKAIKINVLIRRIKKILN